MSSNNCYYKIGDKVDESMGHLYVHRGCEDELFQFLYEQRGVLSIVAARQTGKTSLMFHLAKKFDDYLWVDMRKGYNNIKNAINETVNRAYSIGNENFVVHDILKEKRIQVVCIDELEIITSLSQDDRSAFIGNLLSLASEGIAIMCTSFIELKTFGVASPKAFREIILNDFELSTDNLNLKWTLPLENYFDNSKRKEIAEMVFKKTNGHPLLSSKLFYNILKEKRANSSIELIQVAAIIFKTLQNLKISYINGTAEGDNLEVFNEVDKYLNTRFELIPQFLNAFKEVHQESYIISGDNLEIESMLFTSGLIVRNNSQHQKAIIRNEIFRNIYDKEWIKKKERGFYNTKIEKRSSNNSEVGKNIVVINCGGTIGMIDDGHDIRKPINNEFEEVYSRVYGNSELKVYENITFSYDSIDIKDGANMFPEDWKILAKNIYDKIINGNVDGIVILHGTDTLAYTASAVAFALGRNLDRPVVFTGAQATNLAYYGDAFSNFARAVKVATLGNKLPEVVVCFNDQVFRAVRAEKSNDYLYNGFISHTMKPLAFFSQGVEIHESEIIKPIDEKIVLKNNFESEVLRISQTPGIKNSWYIFLIENFKFKAIIIESLGAGNLPTYSNELYPNYELISLIQKADALEIPVIITSKYPINSDYIDKYDPSKKTIEVGGIWAGNLNSVSAQVKLMWILPQTEDLTNYIEKRKKLAEMLEENFIGELDKK